MRSLTLISDKPDVIKKQCEYVGCAREFFTDNQKVKFCCDRHKGKQHRETHKERILAFKERAIIFQGNRDALKLLYDKKFFDVDDRDLDIAGLKTSALNAPTKTKDGRLCFEFF